MATQPQTFVLNQKLISIGGDLWIEDANGNQVFQVDGKALSIGRKLVLLDAAGTPLFQINQALAHLRKTFEIKRNDQVVATVQAALVNFLGDRFTVTLADGTGLDVRGDFIDREFRITHDGMDVILASRHLLSLRDSYGVQIAPGFDPALGLAIVVAIEQTELAEHGMR